MEKEAPSGITFWKAAHNGLSLTPVTTRLGIKVRPSTSCGGSFAFPGMNIYLEKDIYISMEKMKQFQEVCASFIFKEITRGLCESVRCTILNFLGECFTENTADFEEPDYPFFKLCRDIYFGDR